jgi:hypothetical protein
MVYTKLHLRVFQHMNKIIVKNAADGVEWACVDLRLVDEICQIQSSLDDDFSSERHQHMGEKLFSELMDQTRFHHILSTSGKVCLYLQTGDDLLASLPWESLHDGHQYLALGGRVQVFRHQMLSSPMSLTASPPLNILLTLSPTTSSTKVEYQDEERRIHHFVESTSGLLKLHVIRDANPARIYHALQDAERKQSPFHLWHHVGTVEADRLMFVGGSLHWDELKKLITVFSQLRVLTFNLSSEQPDKNHVLAGWSQLAIPTIAGFMPDSRQTMYSRAEAVITFYRTLLLEGLPQAVQATHYFMNTADVLGYAQWRSFVVNTTTNDVHLLMQRARQGGAHFYGERMTERNQVFISYSHKDKDWLEQLRVHLKPIERQGLIKVWADTDIQAGDEWRAGIEGALASARVAVLLVSPHFLASDFIDHDELPPILEAASNKDLRIFWIPISASVYQMSPISRYQSAHNPQTPLDILSAGEVNQVLSKIALKITQELTR